MTDLCWHCGTPVGRNAATARTPDGPRPACCPGCAAAIETIHGLGLGDYYQWRNGDNPLVPPDTDARELELSLFDLPDLVEPWLRRHDGIVEITLLVEGIHCAACTWLIEKALGEIPGVLDASLNLATHRVRVRWRAGETSPRALAERLLALGYRPRLPARDAGLESRKREQRQLLARLVVAALGTMQTMMFAVALYMGAFDHMATIYRDFFRWFSLLMATPVVFYAGWPFLHGAWRGLRSLAPGMDLPVTLALLMGWGGSAWNTATGGANVYYESVTMLVFFLLTSRWLEQRARWRVGLALGNLRDSLPLVVTRENDDGTETRMPAAAVTTGDRLRFRQGDVLPVDGIIRAGEARLDEAVLTGEFLPRLRCPGGSVAAGSKLVEGRLLVEAHGTVGASRLARIGNLVEQAQEKRQATAVLGQRVAPWFTLAVILLAAVTLLWHAGTGNAFENALAVLVVSCPCALALAAPLSVSAAIGRGLRRGILVADPDQLLAAGSVTDVLFDKTGTLTSGRFALVRQQALADDMDPTRMRAIVAALEARSPHPVARALAAIEAPVEMTDIRESRTGVSGIAFGNSWRVGAAPTATGAPRPGESVLALFREQKPVLLLYLADPLRAGAPELCRALVAAGLRLHLASGDQPAAVAEVARQCGIDSWRAAMSPEDKQAWLTALRQDGHRVLMAGDGVNDAPALAAADVGVAMADSAALARDAAGLYLLHGELEALPAIRRLSRATGRILRQNLAWALVYNVLAVPFAMAGLVPPWLAAIGMSVSSLLVTLNASRLMSTAKRGEQGAQNAAESGDMAWKS